MANEITPVEVPLTDYYFERFRDAFTHTWVKFVGTEERTSLLKFCGENILGTSMFYSFTPSQLETLIDTVFTNATVRDFILTLSAMFHMRIDRGELEWNTMVERLALSYNVTVVHTRQPETFDGKYRLIPNVYADRLPDEADILGYLSANRWLVTVCMIEQCMTIGDINTLAGVKPQKAGTR